MLFLLFQVLSIVLAPSAFAQGMNQDWNLQSSTPKRCFFNPNRDFRQGDRVEPDWCVNATGQVLSSGGIAWGYLGRRVKNSVNSYEYYLENAKLVEYRCPAFRSSSLECTGEIVRVEYVPFACPQNVLCYWSGTGLTVNRPDPEPDCPGYCDHFGCDANGNPLAYKDFDSNVLLAPEDNKMFVYMQKKQRACLGR